MRSADAGLGELLSDLESRLRANTETPRLDAQVLLGHVLGQPRAWVLAHPEVRLTPAQHAALAEAETRLSSGEPLPHVLGHWEFYGLDFQLTPEVLIPRPETELLVEHAKQWLCANPRRRWAADIATGSGCIAVALATHLPDLRVLATDFSLPALKVARANACKHGIPNRVIFLHADLLNFSTSAPFDLLCANLPYIPSSSLPTLAVSQREPLLALDGGADGLALIRRLLLTAPACLAQGGMILLEIEASQGTAAQALARQAFPEARVRLHPDLSAHDRLLEIQT